MTLFRACGHTRDRTKCHIVTTSPTITCNTPAKPQPQNVPGTATPNATATTPGLEPLTLSLPPRPAPQTCLRVLLASPTYQPHPLTSPASPTPPSPTWSLPTNTVQQACSPALPLQAQLEVSSPTPSSKPAHQPYPSKPNLKPTHQHCPASLPTSHGY